MKIPPEKYEVGRGRPPKHTRWKKGQCGNPNRIRKRSPKPVVAMIDEFFRADLLDAKAKAHLPQLIKFGSADPMALAKLADGVTSDALVLPSGTMF